MKKKIVSLALVLALCLSLLPVTAFAEEGENEDSTTTVDTWDGTADTNWYTDHEADTEYYITTAEQLAGLAQLVNADPGTTNFAGKTFHLENDLDLSRHEWISIGTGKGGAQSKYSFCGVFDGQGHVISNLYSHESYIEGADESHNLLRNALFGNVYNGEVKNLGVATADIWIDSDDMSTYGKSILVDFLKDSTVENCWTTGTISGGSKIEKTIGGIAGFTLGNCTISSCYSTATITGNFTNSDNYYDGSFPVFDSLGGIVGRKFYGNLTVKNCWFDGKIVVNSIKATVGGIVGDANTATVKNCMVVTKDIGRDSVTEEVNTCWVAYARGGTVENCYWPNDAKAYDPSPLAYFGGQSNEEQGTAVTDFTSADVLAGLRTNAGAGVEWVAGIGHPTFAWDEWHISADYSAVDAAITAAKAIDSNLYSNYAGVEKAIDAVDRTKSKAEQTKVDAMAAAITVAVNALTYKDADYTAVDTAIEKANALNENDYRDFSAVKAALDAVARDKNITEQAEVDAMAQKINDAIAALEKKPSSSSSGSSRPRYDVTTPSKPENGSVTVDPERARSGSRVTVTVTPDSGYKLGELVVTDKDGKKLELTDKGNGQYTFTMPSGKVEVAAEFVKEVEVSPFADVATDAYYYDAVKWAVNKGITNGVSETLFGPDQACTRAQIVTFLWRAAGSPEPKSGSSFTDVAADAYYAKAVAWAVENGITKGTSETTFHPDETCTRAQGVTFLYRALGKLAAAQAGFTDVAADSYYADAVNWAAENGVTNGISETLFGPDGSCTRAQIVTFLYRAYQGK